MFSLGVAGIGIASFLADVGHEIPHRPSPNLLTAPSALSPPSGLSRASPTASPAWPWSTSISTAARWVWAGAVGGLLGGLDGGLDRRVDAFGCRVGCHAADHVTDLADLAGDQQPDALAFQALGELGEHVDGGDVDGGGGLGVQHDHPGALLGGVGADASA